MAEHLSTKTIEKMRAGMGIVLASKLLPVAKRVFHSIKGSLPELKTAAIALRDNYRAGELPHTGPQKFRASQAPGGLNNRARRAVLRMNQGDVQSFYNVSAPTVKQVKTNTVFNTYTVEPRVQIVSSQAADNVNAFVNAFATVKIMDHDGEPKSFAQEESGDDTVAVPTH